MPPERNLVDFYLTFKRKLIEKGKGRPERALAILNVDLNQNVMEVEADLIPNTEVIQTYIDGELVYSK